MRVINVHRRTLAVAAGLVFLLGTGLSVAQATSGAPEHKVWICHATDSDTNPYGIINVDVASVKYRGHLRHATAPNKIWKSDGTFGGAGHVDGQAKPDIIGVVNAASAPVRCFATPPTTTTTTTPPTVLGEVVTAPPAKVVKGAVVTRAPVVAPAKVTALAFTGAETVPLGLSGLLALLLGAGLIATARRQGRRANN